jgi:hypothetical protein
MFLTKRKLLPNTDGVYIVGGKLHSSPWLVLMVSLMQMKLAYPQKITIDIRHASPLIPQVASMRLMQCGQHCICYNNIFTSCISDHKTFLGLHIVGVWS